MKNLLCVENLKVTYHTYQGDVQSVRGVSFYIDEGETVALVGESGCGKSVTAKSVLRLIKNNGEIHAGSSILFDGNEVMQMSEKQLRSYRGEEVSIIFQDALASLNPTMKVGDQIAEMLIVHQKRKKRKAREEAVELLRSVGIPDPIKRYDLYPHEFSGGQRQRIMIGIALACKPRLLIADEPTTALDVTVQDQILTLLESEQKKRGTAILLITHDLGVVAHFSKRIYVMYAGIVVEEGLAGDIFYNPRHPYTWALLDAVPRLDEEKKDVLETIGGTPPDLIAPPKGCPFAPRCPYCMRLCREYMPDEMTFSNEHRASCFLNDPDAPKVERMAFLKNQAAGQSAREDVR